MKRIIIIAILVFSPFSLKAQVRSIQNAGKKGIKTIITGYVYDKERDIPLEYASVIAYRVRDSIKVKGISTDSRGYFELVGLRPGLYYLEVDFIGYKKKTVTPVVIKPGNPIVELGKIYLEPVPFTTEPIEVTAEAPEITYKIDKKVIYVGKQATSISGTAIDILANVPSVEVDIEGNIKLRGSENFTLLIDGRPTLVEPDEVLQQIPASLIDKIEVITNPSAKYDPEGESGIINIILKKTRRGNTGGTVNLDVGIEKNYGGSVTLSRRTRYYNAYLSFGYNHRNFPGNLETRRDVSVSSGNYTTTSTGSIERTMRPLYLRGGVNINLSSRDILSLGGSYGKWEMQWGNELHYVVIDTLEESYRTTENFTRKSPSFGVFINFEHKFKTKGHTLSSEVYYSRRDGEGKSVSLKYNDKDSIVEGQRVIESGPSNYVRSKIDYRLPLGENNYLEAGYQWQLSRQEDVVDYYSYDTVAMDYILNEQFHREDEYEKDIHSVYALYSGQYERMGFQLGVRGEYTFRNIKELNSRENFAINALDIFPTLHFSYDFTRQKELMFSYTRRIRRPRGWMLEPFETWIDAYTLRKGNPNLKPEYIDSYELVFKTPLSIGLLSLESYYRVIHNKIERIQVLYSPNQNIFLHTFENAGKAIRAGAEIMYNWTPLSFMNLNWSIDFYRYTIEGTLEYGNSSSEKFTWSARFGNELRIGKSTRMQLNFRYRSPEVSLQGKREDFYTVDFGLKHNILENLSLTLQFRDVFRTFRREFTSEGENFTYYQKVERNSPMIILNLQYNFNNYRSRKKENKILEEESSEFEEFY